MSGVNVSAVIYLGDVGAENRNIFVYLIKGAASPSLDVLTPLSPELGC